MNKEMDDEEAIAIVGIGCRFPGANNIDEFWNILVNGENHVKDIPKERWNNDAFYDPDPDAPGKSYVRKAGLLSDHDAWDNKFFGISDTEASQIDPQQRLVLECVHMALEDGGITRKNITGSNTGVYIGSMNDDYRGSSSDGDTTNLNNYTLTGNAPSIISARVSYFYNLLGPAMTIDTACSSALVSIHIAAMSIKTGDCETAICGGVNSILYPEMFIPLSKARMASPSGQCQAFSAKADGYARGEGCGIVIIKQLKKAIEDGNRILATIATGCNQDGNTATPITAPSSEQQLKLLQKIYKENHVDPTYVHYIEAHGTGTPLGDPTEVKSLGAFFKNCHETGDNDNGLRNIKYIGSVKSNIGHTESAAGAAGLIKTVLMMEKGYIVPSLHADELNPKIDFKQYGLDVANKVREWPDKNFPRIACVNSFGFGGTNSHAIVKQYPKQDHKSISEENKPYIIAVSGVDALSLENNLKNLRDSFAERSPSDLHNLSFTLLCKRDHYNNRIAFVANSIQDAKIKFQDKIEVLKKPHLSMEVNERSSCHLVFVFCGVGTTWLSMCRETLLTYPVFLNVLKELDSYLADKTKWSIVSKLSNFTDIEDSFISHIAIFACQIGLAQLWKHWGITPDAIVGQSVGEVAAAYVSGALSLEDAATVIYERSRQLNSIQRGAMAVITNANMFAIEDIIKQREDVCISVYNSPRSCTLSGDQEQLSEVCDAITSIAAGNIHKLNVKCAYHSKIVESCSEKLSNTLDCRSQTKPSIPVYSTVTGDLVNDNFATPSYWKDNVREPVLFSRAIEKSARSNAITIFLEIGPKPVLFAHARDILPNHKIVILPSLKPREEISALEGSLATLYEYGMNPIWCNSFSDRKQFSLMYLPPYAFTRKKNLYESDLRKEKSQGVEENGNAHLFLKGYTSNENTYEATFSPSSTKFVYEHKLNGKIIIPGAVYCEIAFEVGKRYFKCPLRNTRVSFRILNPVFLSNTQTCYLVIKLHTVSDEQVIFSVSKRQNDSVLAEGKINKIKRNGKRVFDLNRIHRFENEVSLQGMYGHLQTLGFTYGETLRHFKSMKISENEVFAEIKLSNGMVFEIGKSNIHPAILDMVLQSVSPMLSKIFSSKDIRMFPVGIETCLLYSQLEKEMFCYSKIIKIQQDHIVMNSLLSGKDGVIIGEFEEIRYRILRDEPVMLDYRYQIAWERIESPLITENALRDYILLISCSNDHMETLKLIFKQDLYKSILASGITLDSMVQTLTQVMTSCNIAGVVFVPGFRSSDDEPSSIEVYKTVSTACHICLKLVQNVDLKTIPLVVVTENTQILSPKNTKDDNGSKINVFGSELWGMVRSIVSEPHQTEIVLIDVCSNLSNNATILRECIVGILNGCIVYIPEILIQNGKLFVNNIKELNVDEHSKEFRENSYDEKCLVSLKSQDDLSILEPFFILENIEPETRVAQKNMVQIESVFLHCSSIFPVTDTQKLERNSVWPDDRNEGHQILAIEGTGSMKQKSQKSCFFPSMSKVSPLDTGNRKAIVFCYPVRLANKVFIPDNCIIEEEKIPGYTPGILHAAFISWHLLPHVPAKASVLIIEDKESSLVLSSLLQKMLQISKHCIVRRVLLDDPTFSVQIEENTVIVLGNVYSVNMAKQLRSVENILGLRHFLPLHCIHDFRLCQSDANIFSLETETIFDSVYMPQTFPKVKEWLLQNWGKVRPQKREIAPKFESSCTLSLPMRNIKDSIAPDRMVRVNKSQLFRQNGCYIVIGGVTGLGWEITKLLSKRGAGYIVTISRRLPNLDIKQQLENLMCICRVKIVTLQADVCDFNQLQNAFENIEKLLPTVPIKGIFQGAGVLKDALYMDMTEDIFDVALRPKVLGTWNLHVLSRKYALDYFVMHSSIASVLGNIKQCNYAAGNSFLDALAHYRRAKGLPGQSINWGALDLGMANGLSVKSYLEDIGFLIFDTEMIKKCLLEALLWNSTQAIYSAFDWNRISENLLYGNQSPLRYRVANFIKKDGTTQGTATTHQLDTLEFHKFSSDQQFSEMLDLVCNITSDILGVEKDSIDRNSTLLGLGMDSQKILEYKNILFDSTGIRVPFVYMTSDTFIIDGLVMHLVDKMNEKYKQETELDPSFIQNKESLTWMENMFYSTYTKNPKEPSLILSLECKISQSLSIPIIWRKVLQWMISANPELRTIHRQYYPERNMTTKMVLEPEEAIVDFRLLDGPLECNEDSELSTFDPCKDLPMRVTLNTSGNVGIVRFVFSIFATDLIGACKLIKEIHSVVVHYLKYDKLPHFAPTEAIEVSRMMNNQMNLCRAQLYDFWEHELSSPIEHITLASTEITDAKQSCSHHIIVIEESLSNRMLSRMEKFIQKRRFDKLSLFTSIYQILLFMRCHVNVVAVRTNSDIRNQLPDIKGTIFFGSNIVPLIAELKSSGVTIEDFLINNHAKIHQCLNHSLYPYYMMKDTKDSFKEIRHEVNIEDLSTLSALAEHKDYWLRPTSVVQGDTAIETGLVFLNNGEQSKIKLRFDQNLIEHNVAQNLLADVIRLLEILIDSPETRLGDLVTSMERIELPRELCSGNLDADANQLPFEDEFIKQTSHGWDHAVYIALIKGNNDDVCVTWGKKRNQMTKLLPVNTIQSISVTKLNGLHTLFLQSEERQFIFKSNDSNTIAKWMTTLNDMISDN